jgi:hypothetical protein
MIEVFKTNVHEPDDAQMLIDNIHSSFTHYKVNFDLDDCDRILRVCSSEDVEAGSVIHFLKRFGFNAEVLPFIFSLIYFNI